MSRVEANAGSGHFPVPNFSMFFYWNVNLLGMMGWNIIWSNSGINIVVWLVMALLLLGLMPRLEELWLSWIESYRVFVQNRNIINSSENLSLYKNKVEFYFKSELSINYLYRRCNKAINVYYWKVQTGSASLFYTDNDDERRTLRNILSTTHVTELKEGVVDDFFRCIMGSFVLEENETLLKSLAVGKPVMIPASNIVFTSQEYLENSVMGYTSQWEDIDDDNDVISSPPAYVLKDAASNDTLVLDVYNGASERTIRNRVVAYRKALPGAKVVVFASGVADILQLHSKSTCSFALWTVDDSQGDGGAVVKVDAIRFGGVFISAQRLNDMYFPQFRGFAEEIVYWLQCMFAQKIIKDS